MERGNSFDFEVLCEADLIIDALYKGGSFGDIRDDPLSKLLGCSNQGGFRITGNTSTSEFKLAVLYSSLDDPDWPDNIDFETGMFVYYGDNKSPGQELHDTPKKGNVLLRFCFDSIHSSPPSREVVPPFFIFTKGPSGRDVRFRGLAAPGAPSLSPTEDLVSIWKTVENKRFQNYKAVFTILNVPRVPRDWIDDLNAGISLSENCPVAWKQWVDSGIYLPLRSPRSIEYRSKEEQLPSSDTKRKIVKCIYEYFKEDPYAFEKCAAEIVRIMDRNIVDVDLTRRWADGGRDALGKYRIGMKDNAILVDFALEAKCYDFNNSVRVKGTSRLISRLRYRQFGILVTTSYVHHYAYKEIKEDLHPVIIVSAEDIANILIDAGYRTKGDVKKWLINNFPVKS